MIRRFTQRLTEVYVRQEAGLSESLEIISYQPEKRFSWKNNVKKTAKYLLETLEKGNLLSNGFKTCPYISFDDVYISFIALAEKTGDLRETMIYLNEKCERQYRNGCRILEALIYPCLITLLSITGCIFLCRLFDGIDMEDLWKAVFCLSCVSFLVLFGVYKIAGEDKLYEAFLAIDFLVKSGSNISNAVGCAVQIVGENSAYGKSFESAREKLEYGMSLQNALKLGEQFEEGFYFADRAGGRNEVFGKLALWLKERDEKKREVCLKLIEPVFIVITGVFLLSLVVKYFLPLMVDFSFVQEV